MPIKNNDYYKLIDCELNITNDQTLITVKNMTKCLKFKYYITDIKLNKIVFAYFTKLQRKGKLIKIMRGTYTKTYEVNLMGKKLCVLPCIDIEQYFKEMLLLDGNTNIGYETGPSLLNRIGLSTWIPTNAHICSNLYKTKIPETAHITLHKPKAKITNDNFRYFQIIDIIKDIKHYHIDAQNKNDIIADYIKKSNINTKELLFYITKYSPCDLNELQNIQEGKNENT